MKKILGFRSNKQTQKRMNMVAKTPGVRELDRLQTLNVAIMLVEIDSVDVVKKYKFIQSIENPPRITLN